tara:strand:- start:226 stop:603 length:378 start_codon:yes stop_codon:yes gene_type:complete
MDEENLFNVAGEEFYLDLDRVSEFIKLERPENDIDSIFKEKSDSVDPDNVKETDDDELSSDDNFGQMIDITKWELTKAMVETVLTENNGEIDESMGIAKLESQLSIPFRISFNTLLINKILKKNG